MRSERYICWCVRRAAMSRRAATARSGIFGWTIRDASCLPLDGRRNSADPRPNLRGEAVRMQRCELRAAATARAFRALGIFPHYALFTCTQSKQPKRVLLVHYCTQSKLLVRSQKHLYSVKTTRRAQAQPLGFQSADVRSRDSARVPKNAKETPGNLEDCEADERPCPDRGLDPPLELYCW